MTDRVERPWRKQWKEYEEEFFNILNSDESQGCVEHPWKKGVEKLERGFIGAK